MKTDYTPEEAARQATQLLMDPFFLFVCDTIENNATNDWKASKEGDIRAREAAWRRIEAIREIKAQLRSFHDAVKVTQHNNRNRLRDTHK